MNNNTLNSDAVAEQFSALLDGEISEQELDELLPKLIDNPAIRSRAAQWNLIGDALRAGLPTVSSAPTTAPYSQPVSQPPMNQAPDNVLRPEPSAWQRWAKPLAGMAVAAGVAAVAVLVGQQPELQSNSRTGSTLASAPNISIAPTGDNSTGLLSAEQLRNVMAASNSTPIEEMTPFELARAARVDANMNEVAPYQTITREELLELQQPPAAQPANR